MKKIILTTALFISTLMSYAQSLFDDLEKMEDVSSVVITKDAFEILSKFTFESDQESKEMNEVFKIIDNLNEFKTFSTTNAATALKMDNRVRELVESQKMTELMRLKEDDSRVWIYVKSTSKKDLVSEVLMLVRGIEKKTNGMSQAMIVSLTGSIDINKMSTLVDTFTKNK
jgi:Asp-tRNA(Asn)/Glu-tRNA(Gln) amidotransferase C subunit